MPKSSTILSAATRNITTLVRARPPITQRREWAAIAIVAARRGGLPAPEVEALRTSFRLQRKIDAEDAAKGEK